MGSGHTRCSQTNLTGRDTACVCDPSQRRWAALAAMVTLHRNLRKWERTANGEVAPGGPVLAAVPSCRAICVVGLMPVADMPRAVFVQNPEI